MAQVAQAGFQADAIKAAGQAQGQAAMVSGIASGISGIVGSFGSMGSGGGDKSYSGFGSKYGSFTYQTRPGYATCG